MPKIRDEDRQFAARLANVLRELRAQTGETREQAAERMGLVPGTLGRWERGDYAPKGYDLGRLYRGYETYGARWQWFFDPPEVVVINPVRAELDASADAGTSAADEATQRRLGTPRRAAGTPRAGRGTPARRRAP